MLGATSTLKMHKKYPNGRLTFNWFLEQLYSMVLERKKKTIKKRYQKWFVSNYHKRNSRINLPTHPNVHWTFFLAIEYGCGTTSFF